MRKEDDTYILELRDKTTDEVITFDNSEFPDRDMDFSSSVVMSPDGTKLSILTMTDTLKFEHKVTIIDLTNGNVINEVESGLLQYMDNETFGWSKDNDTITFKHFDSETWYTLTVDASTISQTYYMEDIQDKRRYLFGDENEYLFIILYLP